MLVELLIHERRLYQRLAVVEHAVYLEGCDVLAEGSELALLNLAHLALRIEHVDMDSVNAEETVGNSRTGIARCSYEHIYLFLAFLTYEVLQETGHEARTHILEGEGRTMEQLERVDVWLYLNYRAVECQGIIYNLLQ